MGCGSSTHTVSPASATTYAAADNVSAIVEAALELENGDFIEFDIEFRQAADGLIGAQWKGSSSLLLLVSIDVKDFASNAQYYINSLAAHGLNMRGVAGHEFPWFARVTRHRLPPT